MHRGRQQAKLEEKEGWTMSRGPGRLQRQIVERLKAAPQRRLSRRELQGIFADQAGYDASNRLRAIRGLERMNLVYLHEAPDLGGSHVSLLLPTAEPVSEEFLLSLLAEAGEPS